MLLHDKGHFADPKEIAIAVRGFFATAARS
jgi:hypothetical protein